MSIASIAIEKKTVTLFAMILIAISGAGSFFSLGWLEDPNFTIKNALVITHYPGASAEEVELEVTDRIEQKIQEMPQIKFIESRSMPGESLIEVTIKDEYWSPEIPQVWDELRRKVRDVETNLPPGADRPIISDDFGDVFGQLLAITSDGFSYAELDETVKTLRKELSLVPGVARVSLWGVQQRVIFVEFSIAQLSQLGISVNTVLDTLRAQNMVVDAGHVDVDTRRVRVAPTGAFRTPEDIANLTIRAGAIDRQGTRSGRRPGDDRATAPRDQGTEALLRLGDIATIERGYFDPPSNIMRHNGLPAIGMGISVIQGGNVVDMGAAVDARLAELESQIPVGIEVHSISWQSDLVIEAINAFMISLAQAVAIVMVVLAIAMGWQMGIIIGTALLLTILGTFTIMAIVGIDLHRVSLGALVVALGMMVDNSIVVADGAYVRLQQGMDKVKAAVEAASQPSWPLLGATLVAVATFLPIGASPGSTGEYCQALLQVVAISLLLSWVLSLTLTPLQCVYMLKVPKTTGDVDPYAGRFFGVFRSLLQAAIRIRWLFMAAMVGLLILSVIGFGQVDQLFFPNSARNQLMVDYWAPQGTRIQHTSADLRDIEERLLEDERVTSVSTFVGSGPIRFYLPVSPEKSYSSYAQLIVNVNDYREIEALIEEHGAWADANVPQAMVRWRKFGLGPGKTWKFEARFSGLANADPDVLRGLAEKGTEILRASPFVEAETIDWRERTPKVHMEYDVARGRWANVTRDEMASALKRSFDGVTIGQFREADELIPIIARNVDTERQNVAAMDVTQIQRDYDARTVPLAQVTNEIGYEWEDSIIWRFDRRRAIKVQAEPPMDSTLDALMADVRADFEALPLPPGYDMVFWGEYHDTIEAQAQLVPGIIPAAIIVLFIIVALFNNFRTPLIILLTIPFAVIGITWGLLIFDTPFGFVALLGAMSLAGMMIKNAIVLMDQIKLDLGAGKTPYQAVIDSALSRLRPVLLAAGTTVLGVVPLLPDVFWVGLAVTIMAGLAFGTVLTMVVLPVLYCIFYRVREDEPAEAGGAAAPVAAPG